MVDKLLRRILDGAILMTGADTGVIYKIRPEDLEVEYEYAPADYQYPKPRKKFPRGLTRTVVRQKRTLPIPDVRNGPYPYNAMPHEALRKEFSSVIVVPLKLINPQRAERVIGVLFLDYRKQHEFPQAEITFLEVLCAQGAAAIRNAELIRDLRAAGLKLTNLDRQLGELHQLTDLKTLIGKVGTDAIEFFGPAVSATIDLYDAKSGRFGTHYPFGKLGGRLRMKPRRNGTGHYVVAHRRPLYYADTHHPPPGQPQPRKALDLLGVVSFAALPLIGRDEVPLGVLFINSTVRLMFGDDLRKTLEVLCSHAVIALENSQTYQRSLRT
jgi:GAF domain-containing protein